MNKKELEFMPGTTADSKFLVLAEKDQVKLGIRPIYEDCNVGFLVGVRVRAQYITGPVEHIDRIKHIEQVFPLPYNVHSTGHCSVTAVALAEKDKNMLGVLVHGSEEKGIPSFPKVLLDKLSKDAGIEIGEEVIHYLQDFYEEHLLGKKDEKKEEENKEKTSNVLQLAPKK